LAGNPKTWGYALEAPQRPALKRQIEAMRSLGINTAENGLVWVDRVTTMKRGRKAGVTQLEQRNWLLDAVMPGDKVVVTDPYCLGVSREDARWFIVELMARKVALLVSGHVYSIEQGVDPKELLDEVERKQNAAHVAAHRAGGIGRKPVKRRKKRTSN
jgi:hypothetical protein